MARACNVTSLSKWIHDRNSTPIQELEWRFRWHYPNSIWQWIQTNPFTHKNYIRNQQMQDDLKERLTKTAIVLVSRLQIAWEFSPSLCTESESLKYLPNLTLCWFQHHRISTQNHHYHYRYHYNCRKRKCKKKKKEVRLRLETWERPERRTRARGEWEPQRGEGDRWLWGIWSAGKKGRGRAATGWPEAIRTTYTSSIRSYSIWFGVCNDALSRAEGRGPRANININIRFRADTKTRWLRDLREN